MSSAYQPGYGEYMCKYLFKVVQVLEQPPETVSDATLPGIAS